MATAQKPCICNVCGKQYASRSALSTHRGRKHRDVPSSRGVVPEEKKTFQCPYCSYHTEPKYKIRMKDHIRAKHLDQARNENVEDSSGSSRLDIIVYEYIRTL